MKRRLTNARTIFALTLVILGMPIKPCSADGWVCHHHNRHHPHVAYVESLAYYDGCRIGWWQTLRYGHVRPV